MKTERNVIQIIHYTLIQLYTITYTLYTDRTSLYAKDPYEAKYKFLINKCK